MISKNNVPYLVAGALATLTLLASGVFAAAPYIGFLAPVAALSVGLPFVIGGAVFSAVAMALSYKAISKNKTISEKVEEISKKDAQLASQAKEIEGKDKIISERDAQLAKKSTDISHLRNQLDEEKVKEEEISKKESEGGEIVEDSSVSRLGIAAVVGAIATGVGVGVVVLGGIAGGMLGVIAGGSILELYVDNSKEGDARRGAIVDNALYTWGASCLLAKEAVNGVLYSGKCAYDNYMPSTESVKGALSSVGGSTKEEKNVATENLSGPKVVAFPDKNDENSALPYVATNTTIQKDPKVSSPENQPTKEENGQSWVAWGKAKVAGIGVCGCVALYYAAPYISTMLEGVSASSVGSETSYTNDTYYPYQRECSKKCVKPHF